MLATKDSTDSTMSRALAHTSNTLDGAILLDVDRTEEDRAFFQAERQKADAALEHVMSAAHAVLLHELRERQKHQARVVIGDASKVRRTDKRGCFWGTNSNRNAVVISGKLNKHLYNTYPSATEVLRVNQVQPYTP